MVMRIIKSEKITGRSYCDNCRVSLKLIDVLPILGYLINRGKCFNCKETIPVKHPIIELIGGLLYLLVFIIIKEFSFELVIGYIMLFVLISETLSDFYEKIVIDTIWIIGLFFLVLLRIVQENILRYLISSTALFSIMFLLALLGKRIFKKEALGGGDIKLYLFIGFVINFYLGLLSLFFASILGLIYAISYKQKPGKEMPFVPMISLGVLICFLFGNDLINWYVNLF
jgi:prepilin signal peptidase PulO-like enzyme (type II secretory pathway)